MMLKVDERLFQRAREGDREAFWQLVLPCRGLVYSVARGMLKDHERAEDQLHDVLLIAFRAIPNLRDPNKLSSWLYSITRNHIQDEMRREQRLRKATQVAAPDFFTLSVTLPAMVPNVAGSLELAAWAAPPAPPA